MKLGALDDEEDWLLLMPGTGAEDIAIGVGKFFRSKCRVMKQKV